MKNYTDLTVGVLDLQGAVSEHCRQIEKLGAKAVKVKNVAQLKEIDALVLPGGESTAIGKLLREAGFIEPIRQFAKQHPIFGTCAGMILLAEQITGGETAHLCLMSISVQRNAFGRQVESFQTDLEVKGLTAPFPAVFIRAPYIARVNSSDVDVLAEFNGNAVLARQGNVLVCAFHPELTDDLRIMQLFLAMI